MDDDTFLKIVVASRPSSEVEAQKPPTLIKRSRLDESIAKLKELLADLESGKLGKEPRAIVVIDAPEGDDSRTVIYGLSMDSETISQAYFILGKAQRRMDGPAK